MSIVQLNLTLCKTIYANAKAIYISGRNMVKGILLKDTKGENTSALLVLDFSDASVDNICLSRQGTQV